MEVTEDLICISAPFARWLVAAEDALVADGDSFDFVGSLSNGPVVLADKNHQGHTGFRIDELSSSINGWLTSAQPDVVLLMIGTNDVLQDYQLVTAPNRLAALADQIHAARPQTKLLLASIPPVATATDEQQVRSYNSAIPDLVQSRAAQGRPISFVDMYQALTTADLADGVHPNATGYSKIASVWHFGTGPGFWRDPAPGYWTAVGHDDDSSERNRRGGVLGSATGDGRKSTIRVVRGRWWFSSVRSRARQLNRSDHGHTDERWHVDVHSPSHRQCCAGGHADALRHRGRRAARHHDDDRVRRDGRVGLLTESCG
ncbi:hypothetical protein BH18ACT12_BH18ACT12_15560 [soil metagenome]